MVLWAHIGKWDVNLKSPEAGADPVVRVSTPQTATVAENG